jgi:hypothetical protein
MDYNRNSNGMMTFMENWSLLFVGITAFLCFGILDFFQNLSGIPWIYFFVASMTLLVSGTTLILIAKMPVYRSGRFFTFGLKSIPERLAGFYRWGWRVFLFGVVLSLCLMLSEQ